MNPNTREALQSKAVNEVMMLVRNYIDRKAEKRRCSNSPFVKKCGLFFEIDKSEVFGIILRGNYSARNDVERTGIAHDVMSEVWERIPSYGNSKGFSVKKTGNLTYVFYDRGSYIV